MTFRRGPKEEVMAESKEGFLQQGTGEVAEIEDNAHQSSWSRLFALSITIFIGFTAHGLSTSLPGATLLDLAHLTGSSIAEVSWIFTGRSLGGILGALLLPLISRVCSCWLPLGICQILQGVLFCLVPLCRTNAQMISLFSVIGVTRSYSDAACCFALLDIWGPANGPWLSGATCMYGIGTIVAPLIAEPFVTSGANYTISYIKLCDNITNTASQNCTLSLAERLNTIHNSMRMNLIKPYVIIGAIVAITGLIFLTNAFLTYRYWDIYSHNSKKDQTRTDQKTSRNDGTVRVNADEAKCKIKFKCAVSFKHVFLIMLSTFIVACCLINHTCGMFLVTFVVEYAKWDKSTAVFLLSVFHGVGTASRGLAAILTKYIQPKYILFSFIAIAVISAVVLALGSKAHFAVIWVTMCGFAVSNAPLYPVGITYTDKYIRVTPTVSAIIQLACTTAAIISPVTLGRLYETAGPISFVYILLVGSCLLLGIFTCMHVLSCQHGERTTTTEVQIKVSSEDKGKDGILEKAL